MFVGFSRFLNVSILFQTSAYYPNLRSVNVDLYFSSQRNCKIWFHTIASYNYYYRVGRYPTLKNLNLYDLYNSRSGTTTLRFSKWNLIIETSLVGDINCLCFS